jgi:hypothetical protein
LPEIEELKGALARALPMRPPRFEPGTAPRVKVSAIEDYMLEAAYMHSELEEAYHWLSLLVEHFKAKVEAVEGYQVALPGGRYTQRDVLAAKRKVAPEVFAAGAEARQLRDSIQRQIARFEWENTTISRAYTIITGG